MKSKVYLAKAKNLYVKEFKKNTKRNIEKWRKAKRYLRTKNQRNE